MRELIYAVVRKHRTYGGPEEGGWYYTQGMVKALLPINTDVRGGSCRYEQDVEMDGYGPDGFQEGSHIIERWTDAEYGEVAKSAVKARDIAAALGFAIGYKDAPYMVVQLLEDWEMQEEMGEDWEAGIEGTCLGSVLNLGCPYYC
jgi:hypothetical protein